VLLLNDITPKKDSIVVDAASQQNNAHENMIEMNRRSTQESVAVVIDDDKVNDLLDIGSSASNLSQNSRLYDAIRLDETENAISLIRSGASCTYKNDSCSWTMLHWACYHGNEKVVDALLGEGSAALEYKTYQFRKEHAPKRCNCNYELEPIAVNTPLHRAAQRGHLEICWMLMLSSYSPDDIDQSGNTCLHLAAANDQQRVVELFIECGANVYVRNKFKNSAYDVAMAPCKSILESAIRAQKSLTKGERTKLRRKCAEKYIEIGNRIATIVDGDNWKDREILASAIRDAKHFGISSLTINYGIRFLGRLDLILNLERISEDIHSKSPITTLCSFEIVDELKIAIERADLHLQQSHAMHSSAGGKLSSFLESIISLDSSAESQTLPHETIMTKLVKNARILCDKSYHEYWLNNLFTKILKSQRVTTSSLARLEEAIERALSAGASDILLADAAQLHAKLSSELELQRVMTSVPIINYDQDNNDALRDNPFYRGHIIEHEQFPLLTETHTEYLWMKAEALTALNKALSELKSALIIAEEAEANLCLVDKSKDLISKLDRVQKSLEMKDIVDKEEAIVAASKLAKKMRKRKKKKK